MGLGTAVAYLTLDATGFARGIDAAMVDAQRLNTGFKDVSNMATYTGQTMTSIGKILTAGITAPILGFGAASIKSGAEFDKSMSDVKAVSMATKTDMKSLSKAADDLGVSYKKGGSDAETAFNALRATAIKMGNDTKFTAKESSDALYYMGLAGWSADQMISGIPAVLSLASAGNTDLARTSDIVTDAITGFGHSAEESVKIVRGGFNKEIPVATRLADIMASTMANSNTDVDLLGESFKYVSPIAGSFGYSMEDVSLSLGLMANAGIKASQAGTTLRQGLKRLVAPTDKAQAVMDKYGWSVSDAQGNIKPLRQQIEELRGIFGNLDIEVTKADGTMKTSEEIMQEYGKKLPVTQQEKLSDAVQVFGTTALPGMLALMGASQDSFDDLSNAIDNSSAAFVVHNGEIMTYKDAVKQYGEELVTTSDAFEVLGAAEGMSKIQLDNLMGDWTLFKSALGTTKQIISDMVSGSLRNLVQGLTDVVRKFNELEPAQQKNILKLALIAASIGPLLIGVGKVVTGLGRFQFALSALTGVGTPVYNLMGRLAIRALNVKEGFALAQAGFPTLGRQASLLGSKLGTVTAAFTSASTAAGGGFVGAIHGAGAAIGAFFTPVTIIISVIALLVAAFIHLMKTNEEFKEKVEEKTKALKDKLSGLFQEIVDAVNSLGFNFKDIADLISSAWDGLCKALAPILQGLVTTITTAIGAIAQVVTGLVQVIAGVIGIIKGFITGDGEQIKTSLDVLWRGIVNIFLGAVQLILAPVLGLFDTINEVFGTNLPTTFNEFKDVIVNVFNTVVNALKQAISFIQSIPLRIKTAFSILGKLFYELGKEIQTVLKQAGEVISNWVDSVIKWFKKLPKNISNLLSKVGKTISDFVSDLSKRAKEIGDKFVNAVIKFFSNLPYKIGYAIGYATTTVAKFVTDLVHRAEEIKTKFVNAVVKFFNELPGKIQRAVSDAYNYVKNWVSDMLHQAKELGKQFLQNIDKYFIQLPKKAWKYFDATIDKAVKFLEQMILKGAEAGSKFVKNAIKFLRELPGKAWNYLDSTVNKAAKFLEQMILKGSQAGSQFVINVGNQLAQLPGKVWNALLQAINQAQQFVIQMGQKGAQAASDLRDKFIQGASNIASQVVSIGSNIVRGVWNGIVSAGGWFRSQIASFFKGMVDGAKSALGIHSPSTVFEKEVGLNIVLGVAKGVKKNSKYATDAINYMMKSVLSVTAKSYDEQYEIISTSLAKTQERINGVEKQIQKTTDKNDKTRLKKLLVTLKSQRNAQKQAIKDLQSDYLAYCDKQLSQETQLYNYSNKQIVEYWKNVRSHLKKGTAAYKEASEKIADAQVNMYAEIVSKAEESLNKMKEDRDVSLVEQITYWRKVRKECLVGSKAYEDATDKIKAAQKELSNGTINAFNTLKEGLTGIAQEVKSNIESIVNSYNDAVNSTKESLMGLAGLFEAFNTDAATSGDDLVSNLQTQVDGLEQWNAVIDRMFDRNLPQGLIEELQAMGPKAMGSIVNLLNMTDEQLSNYVELWERKNQEAQSAALKMVDKVPYVEQIQGVMAEASQSVEKLLSEYKTSLEELGVTTDEKAMEMAVSFANDFVSTLKTDLESIDFGFIGDIFKKERFSGIGVTMSKPLNEALIQGMQQAIQNAVETVETESPVLTEAVQDAVDEQKVDVSGYVDKGVEVVDNITTGVQNQSPVLYSQVTTTGLTSQDSFISSIKSKEEEVYQEGLAIGKQLDDGMAAGIEQYVGNVIAAAVAAVQAAIAAARAAAAISSPSKVMANQVGKWLPLGMAKGFIDYIPQATDEMQSSIDSSLDSLQAKDIDIFPNVKSVSEDIRDAFKDVSIWFSDVSKSVTAMTDTMKDNIQDVVDITDGMLYNVYDRGSDTLNNLISGKNTVSVPQNNVIQTDNTGMDNNNQTNNTFIFNSPKPIDEVQASRLIRQTSRNLAEGFG